MSRRKLAPIVLREFQAEAVEALAGAMVETVAKLRAAPERRREITKQIGWALLEAPTASGKTVMLAATAERVSAAVPVVWFWFAPFRGVTEQTVTALRMAAPSLRVRDPRNDRIAVGTRPGDVFIMTWAAVAARNAASRKMRMDDDELPALDTLVRQLRDAGMVLGAVVDEAHHSFRSGTQAFTFFQEILRPDLVMLATATPDDKDVELLRRVLDVQKFQRIGIARERVVAARLNKRSVRAISFVARGTAQKLLDVNEVALRKAVEQHRALKQQLKNASVAMVPLLLVQAASAAWTPARVREFLLTHMQFEAKAIGVHTSDEPDPDVQALANDPQCEVLVFKMAVATGFDAPRASVLCALRAVQDAGFGLQVIGRIMRVHPLLQRRMDMPVELDTGYVFLGDAESQAGLKAAAAQIKQIKNAIQVSTDRVEVYLAAADEHGEIVVEDETGQRLFVLEAPEAEAAYVPRPYATVPPYQFDEALPMFDLVDRARRDLAASAGPVAMAEFVVGSARIAARKPYSYAVRPGICPPKRLRTEKMPADRNVLVQQLVNNVAFTSEHLQMVRQRRASVDREDVEVFDATINRSTEQAAISDLFARQNAVPMFRISSYIDPGDLASRLVKRLSEKAEEAGEDVPDVKILRRALNVILVRNPRLLKDALRQAMNACAELVDAAELPTSWDSDESLPASALNLFGCLPNGLNSWEVAFADWLDRQEGKVVWWLRNVVSQSENHWGVRIVLPETGKGYYPDFIICVNGRRKPDGIALAETKARFEDADSGAKNRTEHREYGLAFMLSYERSEERFIRVEYDPILGKNKETRIFQVDDLRT